MSAHRHGNIALNALRAAAAILVVVGHSWNALMQDYSGVVHSPFVRLAYTASSLQHPAVMVFFVLSGFWVGGSVLRTVPGGRFSWKRFAIARLSRLWLVLIPALALTAVITAIGFHWYGDTAMFRGNPAYQLDLGDLHGRFTVPVAFGNVAFLQGIHVKAFAINGPLWSLGYEFWFYFIFPLLVVAALGLRNRNVRAIAALAVAALTLALLGTKLTEYFLLWLFGASAAAFAARAVRFSDRWTWRQLTMMRFVTVVVVLVVSYWDKGHIGYASDVFVGIAATALVLLLVSDVRPGSSIEPLAAYAHSSYSLYAIHFPILALVVAIIHPRIDQRWTPTVSHFLAMLAIDAGIIACGWIFAQGTERHTDTVRRLLTARLRTRPEVAAQA